MPATRLASVELQHYKSLDSVRISLERGVTVLVGPNAVGKSNFVDALRFARDAVKEDLDHAVTQHGGITRVRQWSRTKPYNVSLSLQFSELTDGGERSPSYSFTIKSLNDGNFIVDSERCTWWELVTRFRSKDENQSLELIEEEEANSLTRDATGRILRDGVLTEFKLTPKDQLAFAQQATPLTEFVAQWRFATLYPNRLKEPSLPVSDKDLKEDGSNWASVIRAMKRTSDGKAGLEKINEAMRAVVPGFKEVTVATAGSYLVPWFWFDTNGEALKFDPPQLSDGTLRIFGLLLALYQTPPPPLLVVEEPEQTVHPGVLSVLADAFKEAAEYTQIIVTTHSPHLVDCFDPSSVRVVAMNDGRSDIRPLRASQLEAVKRKLMSLEEFMLAEGLQGETP